MMLISRSQRAVLLLEVAVVVLLVSIASLYFFRGYSIFIKAGRKSLDYLRLSLFVEEKCALLQLQGPADFNERPLSQDENQTDYSWGLTVVDTEYDNLKKGVVAARTGERKESFDAVLYFFNRQ